MVNVRDDGEVAYAGGGKTLGSECIVVVGDEFGVFLLGGGVEGCCWSIRDDANSSYGSDW